MAQALTTVFKAPLWCWDRFAMFIDDNPYHSSTLSPSRGWVDPSFSKCVPTQYTDSQQTLSPGVCPDYMTIARSDSNIQGSKTTWFGGCCQSGFSDMSGYYCTSTVEAPMAFLLAANISTTDIYTTLSNLWIEHDQMTVAWQETDLKNIPKEVATGYASIMGMGIVTTTITTTPSDAATPTTGSPTEGSSVTVATQTSMVPSSTASAAKSSKKTATTTSECSSTATPCGSGRRISPKLVTPLVAWLVVWAFTT
ncbi:hypothetical protein F5Y04DRAFT_244085 [Hypomontagnella monticulosa]|nr:hypothetical protein F5Y04DRAFT_244085 [Hypomontagnella monticulosa]